MLTPIDMLTLCIDNDLMSEDLTEKAPTTKPTIETILEKLSEFRQSVDARFDKLENDISSLQTEMQTGFRKIEYRMSILSDDMNKVRADIREHESRIALLEEKAS